MNFNDRDIKTYILDRIIICLKTQYNHDGDDSTSSSTSSSSEEIDQMDDDNDSFST